MVGAVVAVAGEWVLKVQLVRLKTFGWKLHWLCNLLNGFLSQDTGIVTIAGARGRRLWTGNVHFTSVVFLDAAIDCYLKKANVCTNSSNLVVKSWLSMGVPC